MSRKHLLNKIWSEEEFVFDRIVDIHISRIKNKIGSYEDCIKTPVGGYKFVS